MDKQLCITESSSCTPETKTSEINYIPTKNYREITELKKKKEEKKRKDCSLEKCCHLVVIFCNNTMQSCAAGYLIFIRIQGL